MEKAKASTVFWGKKHLLIILIVVAPAIMALPCAAEAQSDKVERHQIARQIADNWIQVGTKQYERGFYRQAEQSFVRARDYERHLSAEQRGKLTISLEKARAASRERKRVLVSIQNADELIKDGRLIKARADLEKLGVSEFLTEAERRGVSARIKQVDSQLGQRKKRLIELYNQSVKLYQTGYFEKARQGFVEVAANGSVVPSEAKKAQQNVAEIDDLLARQAAYSEPVETQAFEIVSEIPAAEPLWRTKPVTVESRGPSLIDVAGPITDAEGGIEGVNRQINILRSYTRAIVSDAAVKAQSFIGQGQYYKAKEVVEAATREVNENRLPLGEDLFTRHIGQLKQLEEKIIRARGQEGQQLRERQRLAAIAQDAKRQYSEAQRRYKEQVEAERKERVTRRITSASVYLQQGRYKEAAKQLNQAIELIKKIAWE